MSDLELGGQAVPSPQPTAEATAGGDSVQEVDVDESQQSIASLEKVQQWLSTRKDQINTALIAAEDDSPVPENCEDCAEMIEELSRELLKLSSMNSVKELLVRRLQLGDELENNLFGTQKPGPAGDVENESLLAYAQKQASLVSEVLGVDNENKQLQSELVELQKQNFEIKISNRDLMSQLQECQQEQTSVSQQFKDNEAVKQAKDVLEVLTNKINLQRNVLQALVVGSGVNWAADDDLKKMVVKLGKPLPF